MFAPSLRQQLVLVLCFDRVTETRFLTDQRAYFLRTCFLILFNTFFIVNQYQFHFCLFRCCNLLVNNNNNNNNNNDYNNNININGVDKDKTFTCRILSFNHQTSYYRKHGGQLQPWGLQAHIIKWTITTYTAQRITM